MPLPQMLRKSRGLPDFVHEALESMPLDRRVMAIVDTAKILRMAYLEAVRPLLGMFDVGLLTNRERQTISLVIAGKSRKEIAGLMGTARHTVDQHLYAAYRKLGVENVVGLVNLWWRHSILDGRIQ